MRQEDTHKDDGIKCKQRFSEPYDYNLHSKHCAVGATERHVHCDERLYEKMNDLQVVVWKI